ncbi:MAG: hypothetical protein DCF16_04285 [Alphaproteobacteria bacterium]|nr:MAG: hypothetical protein DCF16_04285 [Alphaproteobacteria bacterium]
MTAPQQPPHERDAKSGVKPGETPGTDKSSKPDRPVDEEDVFGGHERTHKSDDVESGSVKP